MRSIGAAWRTMRPSLGLGTACTAYAERTMPGTIDRGRLATPGDPHRHHPAARMPERRPASGIQGVPDPQAGIDAGGTRDAGLTGAGPLRGDSREVAGGGRPLRSRSHPGRRPLHRPRCRAACARHGKSIPGSADRAERRPRQCSRRLGNASPRHWRWHDAGRLLPEPFRAAIADARVAPKGARNGSGAD